jgi:hypothetical protein
MRYESCWVRFDSQQEREEVDNDRDEFGVTPWAWPEKELGERWKRALQEDSHLHHYELNSHCENKIHRTSHPLSGSCLERAMNRKTYLRVGFLLSHTTAGVSEYGLLFPNRKDNWERKVLGRAGYELPGSASGYSSSSMAQNNPKWSSCHSPFWESNSLHNVRM